MSDVNISSEPTFLAENIRNLRKQRNWSQEELAKNVGLNRGNIASYEKGTAEPKICNLLKIAQLFGISILDLLGRDLRNADGLPISENGKHAENWKIDQEKWSQFIAHADELEKVVEGIYHCHCFKLKNIHNADKDVRIISNQFDQLYEATRSLLKSHKELLGYMEQEVRI